MNTVFNLMNFKSFPIIPFVLRIYCVRCRNISISEEIKTIEENNKEDNMKLLFGIMPKKWNYDTYCYSDRYKKVDTVNDKKYNYLKKNHLLKVSPQYKNKKTDD